MGDFGFSLAKVLCVKRAKLLSHIDQNDDRLLDSLPLDKKTFKRRKRW